MSTKTMVIYLSAVCLSDHSGCGTVESAVCWRATTRGGRCNKCLRGYFRRGLRQTLWQSDIQLAYGFIMQTQHKAIGIRLTLITLDDERADGWYIRRSQRKHSRKQQSFYGRFNNKTMQRALSLSESCLPVPFVLLHRIQCNSVWIDV